MSGRPIFDYPLFNMGFRVFFALAGASALALIAAWNHFAHGVLHIDNYFPASLWHGHEMLLGYASAVIAGFLLTAIQNWTGVAPVNRQQLVTLSLLWLYGRVVPFYSEALPDSLIALIDFAFLPLLAFYVTRCLIGRSQAINLIFPVLLLLIALGNGIVHLNILGWSDLNASSGLNLVISVILLMILVIAGRIFPFFTERGIPGVVCIRNATLDGITLTSSLLALLLWISELEGWPLALAALIASLINSLRIANWFDRRVLFVPLLWVLYIGYAWIILGFVLMALAAIGWLNTSLTLHAFTVGGIGVLTLGIMARVALGHTGRALKASNVMALAFVLINLAALFRVLFPALLPTFYSTGLWASTYCWLAAFSLFVYYYLPILGSARADGKSG